MLTAEQTGFWGRSYRIGVDGRPLTTFTPRQWSAGGRFSLDGQDYELRSNAWGGKYAMTTGTDGGSAIATAEKVGRKRWLVQADARTYQFQRVSLWRGDQALLTDGRQVGVIKRTSTWKANASAELPGLSLPVQVFVVAVVVTMWRTQAAAAAAGA